jgi:hypothetical protein
VSWDSDTLRTPATAYAQTLAAILFRTYLTTLDKELNLKKGLILTFFLLALVLTCCNKTEKNLLATDIRGTWYLNKWTSYHTLTFDDSTIFVDNNTDTVFTFSYTIDDNLLLTRAQFEQQSTVDTITWLTSDSLVLSGIHSIREIRSYNRTKKKGDE